MWGKVWEHDISTTDILGGPRSFRLGLACELDELLQLENLMFLEGLGSNLAQSLQDVCNSFWALPRQLRNASHLTTIFHHGLASQCFG